MLFRSSVVLKDRKHLAQDGIIIVAAAVDYDSGLVISGPDVVSRGFVYVREAEELMEDARILAFETIEKYARSYDKGLLKTRLRDEMSKLMYERTKRSPMIMPVILEV